MSKPESASKVTQKEYYTLLCDTARVSDLTWRQAIEEVGRTIIAQGLHWKKEYKLRDNAVSFFTAFEKRNAVPAVFKPEKNV